LPDRQAAQGLFLVGEEDLVGAVDGRHYFPIRRGHTIPYENLGIRITGSPGLSYRVTDVCGGVPWRLR
jgi:hypothetical protein